MTYPAVADKLLMLLALVESAYQRKFDLPEIRFDFKSTNCAIAYFNRNLLRFNPAYFQTDYDLMLNEVVAHEFAHLVADKVFGDRRHGAGWRAVMRVLGVKANRCYNISKPVTYRETFEFICIDCHKLFYFTSVRKNRLMVGESSYSCPCGGNISYKKWVDFRKKNVMLNA